MTRLRCPRACIPKPRALLLSVEEPRRTRWRAAAGATEMQTFRDEAGVSDRFDIDEEDSVVVDESNVDANLDLGRPGTEIP